jgi:hypothetical protein
MRSYSTTSLTHSTDKLIALSAIAKEYAVAIGDEYVAGLWRRDLLRQLCWFRTWWHIYEVESAEDSLPYQAPSWSWASLNSPVCNELTLENCFIDEACHELFSTNKENIGAREGNTKIMDVSIAPVGQDITGQVTRGIITI